MGEVVGPLLSGASSLFSYGTAHYENVRNQHFQHDEAALARDFNSEEAAKSRAFTQDMYNQQVVENRRLIANEREYSSPAAQVGRLQSAGINPAVYFGQGSTVASAQSHTTPTPGTSPAASVGIASGTNQVPSLNFGSTFKDIAEGLNLASKTKTENLLRSPLFQQAMEDVLGKKLSNDSMRILNYVQENIKDIKIKQAVQELANSVAQESLAQSETELNKAKTETESILQVLNSRLSKKTQTEYLLLKNELGVWKQTYDQEQRVLKSEEQRNKAQATEARASAQNQKAQAALTDLERTIKHNVQGDIEDSYLEELNKLKNENAISEQQLEIAKATKKIQEVAADHAEALFWRDFFLGIISGGADVTNAFAHLKSARSWAAMSENSKKRVEVQIERLKHEYGDKVEITSPNSRGGVVKKTYRRPYQKFGKSRD